MRERTVFQVETRRIKSKQAKISLGVKRITPLRIFVACCVPDYKGFLYPADVLFVTWFQYGHCEVLSYLSEPGPQFMTRDAAAPPFLSFPFSSFFLFFLPRTRCPHIFWQEIDSVSAANSWMR